MHQEKSDHSKAQVPGEELAINLSSATEIAPFGVCSLMLAIKNILAQWSPLAAQYATAASALAFD